MVEAAVKDIRSRNREKYFILSNIECQFKISFNLESNFLGIASLSKQDNNFMQCRVLVTVHVKSYNNIFSTLR